jgi:hypothetical protein
VYCETKKKTPCVGPFRTKGEEQWQPVYSYCSSMLTHVHTQLLALKHCWSISTCSCLTTLLTAMILFRTTTTCLSTWRASQYHSTSTIMRSWWKVLKCGWAYRQQTSLTRIYEILYLDTSASISAVTMLRSSLSMNAFFVFNKISFFHCLFC